MIIFNHIKDKTIFLSIFLIRYETILNKNDEKFVIEY